MWISALLASPSSERGAARTGSCHQTCMQEGRSWSPSIAGATAPFPRAILLQETATRADSPTGSCFCAFLYNSDLRTVVYKMLEQTAGQVHCCCRLIRITLHCATSAPGTLRKSRLHYCCCTRSVELGITNRSSHAVCPRDVPNQHFLCLPHSLPTGLTLPHSARQIPVLHNFSLGRWLLE